MIGIPLKSPIQRTLEGLVGFVSQLYNFLCHDYALQHPCGRWLFSALGAGHRSCITVLPVLNNKPRNVSPEREHSAQCWSGPWTILETSLRLSCEKASDLFQEQNFRSFVLLPKSSDSFWTRLCVLATLNSVFGSASRKALTWSDPLQQVGCLISSVYAT